MPVTSKFLTALATALLSATAIASIAEAAPRGGNQMQQPMRPIMRATPAPVMKAVVVRPTPPPIAKIAVQRPLLQPVRTDLRPAVKPVIAAPKLVTQIERPTRLTRDIPRNEARPNIANVASRPDPRVTTTQKDLGAKTHDPRVTTTAHDLSPRKGDDKGGKPVKIANTGVTANGGNNNNNAGPGEKTGGTVGQGGTATVSEDYKVKVGKGDTLVIGGSSADGGNGNGNANGKGAQSGNGAGKGGTAVDDRDYKIKTKDGATVVVKADHANGGNNNGNGTNGGKAGTGNGNGGNVVDDRDITIKGGRNNTIIIEKDEAKAGHSNGAGNGQAGSVKDTRDIRVEVGKGDKVVYGGKELETRAGDTVVIHDGVATVEHGGRRGHN